MSKPSQPTLFDHQTEASPKSSLEFFTLLPFIQLNPTHPSDNTHFSVIRLQFMLNFHRPGLTAMHQTTLHTSSIYLSVLNRILFPLEWVSIQETFSKQI